MERAQDTVFYSHGNDRVTSRSATFNGRTYDLAGIDSVSLVPPVLRREYGYVVLVVGLVILVAGYLIWGILLTPVAAGAILIVVGIAMLVSIRNHYTLRLNSAANGVNTVQFINQAEAEQAVSALSQALGQRK